MRLLGIILTIVFFVSSSAYAEELIIYSSYAGNYWQIWAINPVSLEGEQITRSKRDKRDPTWCSNGELIAYRTNNGQLFTVEVNKKDEKQVLKNLLHINNPSCLPNSDEMVFTRYLPLATDKSSLWKVNLKEGKPKLLTKQKKLQYQPVFSPDGTKVSYVKAEIPGLSHNIWIMDADGANQKQITFGQKFDTLPAFSPTRDEIVFSSNRTDNYEIYLENLDSKKVRQLTDYSGLDSSPVFSPDGEQIAFVSNRSGDQQIWIMDRNGENLKMITAGERESIDPSWIKTSQRSGE